MVDITIQIDLTERHFHIALFLTLLAFLFNIVINGSGNFGYYALNLIGAVCVAFIVYWFFVQAFGDADGNETDEMFGSLSFRTIVIYLAIIGLIALLLVLVGYFVMGLLQIYARIILSSPTWLLFLLIPIMVIIIVIHRLFEETRYDDYVGVGVIDSQGADTDEEDEIAEEPNDGGNGAIPDDADESARTILDEDDTITIDAEDAIPSEDPSENDTGGN
jgi:hypothetical protein